MVMGALFEPRALLGSMSPTPFTEIRLGGTSADCVADELFAETAVFFGVCAFWAEGAATKSRLPIHRFLRIRVEMKMNSRPEYHS
jgi:hypothetical protein